MFSLTYYLEKSLMEMYLHQKIVLIVSSLFEQPDECVLHASLSQKFEYLNERPAI